MRRIRGTLHHRWRMALFGTIQLPSSWGDFKAGQKHGTLYAVRCPRSLIHIKRGDGRGEKGGERRWGEMCPRLGVGMVPKPAPTPGISNLLLLQPHPRTNNTEPRRRRRHPNDTHHGAFPAFPERMARADPS